MGFLKYLTPGRILWIQITGALLLCGSMFFRLLKNTEGQLLGSTSLILLFCSMQLLLAFRAHRACPDENTKLLLWTYVMWFFLILSNVIAYFINGNYIWKENDTGVLAIALSCAIVVLRLAFALNKKFKDPMVKGLLAILFKAVPQFMMARQIIMEGGAGIPAVAIIAGHITILTRIRQIQFASQKSGEERNRYWLYISEGANELSWVAVSTVWLIWLFK